MLPVYLVISPFFPHPRFFQGPFVFDQVQAIAQTGNYKVLVLKPKPWYSNEKDYDYEGVKVYRFNTYELPSNILPGLFNLLSVWSILRKLKSLNINNKDIRVVHAHVTGTGFLANALKRRNPVIKTLLQHHGLDVLSLTNGRFSNFSWHRSWVKAYGIRTCNLIGLHIGVSAKTLEYLRAYPEIKIKDSYVLYNGVDTSKFYPIEGLKDPVYFTIGCIGNFWELKDQLTLIKAIEKLGTEGIDNVRVIFIGSGAMLEMCRKYVIQHKLSRYIEFRKEVPHKELCQFYNTLHLFVLPSYHEAFGCVYTEAYACGVPFIGVEGQGIAELISEQDTQNWLIKKGDFENLSKLILKQLNHPLKQQLTINPEINHLLSIFFSKLNNNA